MHWCLGLCPWPSGGWSHVQGWLQALGVWSQPACWWVWLCPCLANCLAKGISVLVSTGWWDGPRLGPKASKVQGGFQNGSSVCVPRMTSSCFLFLWETLQDQQVGLTQAPFKLLLLPWVPEHVRFCVLPLRVESLFHTVLRLSRK